MVRRRYYRHKKLLIAQYKDLFLIGVKKWRQGLKSRLPIWRKQEAPGNNTSFDLANQSGQRIFTRFLKFLWLGIAGNYPGILRKCFGNFKKNPTFADSIRKTKNFIQK